MSEGTKKYIKMYCPKSKCYGLVTAEMNNGSWKITNFYEIDNDTAKSINTTHEGALYPVSAHLKPCASCGKRTVGCCDKTRGCPVPKGELWYQCLFCSGLEVHKEASSGGADFYFLLDQSGSMSTSDRCEASRAVRSMMRSLQGNGNTYSFVAWGSDAGYLFRNETNMSKMTSALSSYESGSTPYGGSTAADRAFDLIRGDVNRAKRPVRIIFVTDGGFDDDAAAGRARDAVVNANKNVEILAIGVTGAIEASLRRIGTVPKFSKVVGGTSALTSTFEDIAKVLKNNGNNF